MAVEYANGKKLRFHIQMNKNFALVGDIVYLWSIKKQRNLINGLKRNNKNVEKP